MCNQLKMFFLWINYKLSEMKNFYTHNMVDFEDNPENGKTTIFYTILGKRDVYSNLLSDIMLNSTLLEKFHPMHSSVLGAFAMGELIYPYLNEDQKKQYKKIKESMLRKNSKTKNKDKDKYDDK